MKAKDADSDIIAVDGAGHRWRIPERGEVPGLFADFICANVGCDLLIDYSGVAPRFYDRDGDEVETVDETTPCAGSKGGAS